MVTNADECGGAPAGWKRAYVIIERPLTAISSRMRELSGRMGGLEGGRTL